jgi:hypothetical protein
MVPRAEPRRLVGQLERLLVPAELLFHPTHLAEIPDPLGEAEQLPVAVIDPGGRDRGPELGAVLPHQPLLPGRAPVGGGLRKLLLREAGGPVLRGKQVGRGGSEEFGLSVAQHPLDALVPAPVVPSVVHDEDGVILHLVGRGAIALFGPAMELLGVLARRHLAPELHLHGAQLLGGGVGATAHLVQSEGKEHDQSHRHGRGHDIGNEGHSGTRGNLQAGRNGERGRRRAAMVSAGYAESKGGRRGLQTRRLGG